MMSIPTISARDMLRNYKGVMAKVRKTGRPVIVTNRKELQVALVSLADLELLHLAKQRKATQALLDLAGSIPKGTGLPADLAKNHSEYAWD